MDINGTAASPSIYPCFHGSKISKNLSELAFSAGKMTHVHSTAAVDVAAADDTDGAVLIGEDGES